MSTAEVIKNCRTLPGVTVKEGEDYLELLLSTQEGNGKMRFFPLFSGITLALISVSAPTWPAPVLADCAPDARGPLLLNYCIRGRCELVLNDGRSVFLTAGHISLTERFARGEYVYPGRTYEGLELFIDPDSAQNALLRDQFGLDIAALQAQYCPDGHTFLAKLPLPDALLDRLRGLNGDAQAEHCIGMKTGTIDLLAQLQYRPVAAAPGRLVYYTRSQVEMARRIEAAICENLAQQHTAREFAACYGISESSIKNYFYGVYGQSIAQYTRHLRLLHAAELLTTTKLPVAEIAGRVGYENQSKFSAAFRKKMGVSPLEYRRGLKLCK